MKKLSKQDSEEILRLFLTEKLNKKNIAEIFKVTCGCITYQLRKMGIITPQSLRETQFDIHFFDTIDTPVKSQILGLLFADGNNYLKNYRIKITLASQDQEYLEKVRQLLNLNRGLYFEEVKNNEQAKYTLTIYSKHLSTQLSKLGCVPNKSLTLKFPTFDQVPENLMKHFILGYVEGDGCIYFHNKSKQGYVSIASSQDFCESLKKYLFSKKIKSYVVKQKNIYCLMVGGNKQVQKFLDFIYEDAPFVMIRKYKKYLLFKGNRTHRIKTSKYLGVSRKTETQWAAQSPWNIIKNNKPSRYIGVFNSEEDAARAFDSFMRKHFPEYNDFNFN